ncbi:MAG: hypothetical protein IJ572_02510 [Bacilli bacterium]|nr:hypothetical protein [Bacilli bacterium]
MNDEKYVLVVEERPNSYNPIYWSNNDIYNLEKIDEFTSSFDEESLFNYLIDNNMLSYIDRDKSLQIIYNNNGIRKLSSGVIYKDLFNTDMVNYVIEFIQNNKDNSDILNKLYQKVLSDRLISTYTKEIISNIFRLRKENVEDLKTIINNLCDSKYVDIRIIYLYIKKELELQLEVNNKLILNKKSDEI